MICLTKLFQQKRRRIGYILAFSDPTISKRDSSGNKHYIKYSACYKLPIPKTPFYPDAYKFANTKEEFLSNMKLINNAIKVEAIIDTNKLDFNNHTYLFVFGAPIKKMYYSFKTTLFDDKSPSYAKAIRHKKKCVFINYNIPTGYTYLYEIKKDETLTGFNGI